MDVNLEAGVFADERAGGTSVVKMNVGKENGVEVGDRKAMLGELFAEGGEGRGRPRIDEGHVSLRAQEGGGNRVTMANPKKIDGDRRIHGK
jgi:hypothetical protein